MTGLSRFILAFRLFAALALLLGMAVPSFALDKKYLGSWSTSAKCEEDMIVHIKRDEYSGTEFHCRALRSKREKGGWRADFSCAAEGEEYALSVHWMLTKNGRLKQAIDGRRVVEMRRCSPAVTRSSQPSNFAQECMSCFNEAQQLGRSVGGFCRPNCADVFMTMVCDSKGSNCSLPN